jgi:cell filamentation protein
MSERPDSAGTRALQDQDRECLEADATRGRIVELQLLPVQGCFDAAHLCEVNRRIFQDLPSLGFRDVAPGQYRPEVVSGNWMKNRGLTTMAGDFFVAYSSMDAASQARIEAVLKCADPVLLARLDTPAFTKAIAQIYAELDYLHPFSDGNSRTLRTFTRQLANASGYELDWARFNFSASTRDALYIARDKAVNAIALPQMQNERSMMRIIGAMKRLSPFRNLAQILQEQEAVFPLDLRS